MSIRHQASSLTSSFSGSARSLSTKRRRSLSSSNSLRRPAPVSYTHLYSIKEEYTTNPHNEHNDGTLAMARSQDPNSAGSQFYFCLGAQPMLDSGYTVFGDKMCIRDSRRAGPSRRPGLNAAGHPPSASRRPIVPHAPARRDADGLPAFLRL